MHPALYGAWGGVMKTSFSLKQLPAWPSPSQQRKRSHLGAKCTSPAWYLSYLPMKGEHPFG